jgi:hypothetical protein
MHSGAETRAYGSPAGKLRAGKPCAAAKKSPADWRGKTDSLEISQRGKTGIYTKFMSEGKRKTNKIWALSNVMHAKMSQRVGDPVMR